LLLTVIIKRKSWFKNKKWFWVSLIVFLSVYASILIYTMYLAEYYATQLQSFDLDNNGLFSEDEITPEQQKAQLRVIADNARNLSFITGLVLAFLIALPTYLGGKLFQFYKNRR